MTKKITYKEIQAPNDDSYKDLWPEIIGTNCWICTSHKKTCSIYRKIMNCPKDLIVMHKCDNCMCINPLHLKIGTKKENSEDCIKKGRNLNSRLTASKTWKGKKRGPFSEEHLKKLSKALKGKGKKSVVKIDMLTGEVIAKFNSIQEAAEQTGIWRATISYCCNGHIDSYKNYIWKFDN